jgi:hypothetical protein
MHKFGTMLVALAAIILTAPTALAFHKDDDKTCLRGVKVPGVGQRSKPDPRPARPAPAERKPVEKSEAAESPATAAAAHVEPNIAPSRCQKYFPVIGQLVDVPCHK